MPYLNFFFQEYFEGTDFPDAFEVVGHGQHYIFDNFLGESIQGDGNVVDQQGEAFPVRFDEAGFE